MSNKSISVVKTGDLYKFDIRPEIIENDDFSYSPKPQNSTSLYSFSFKLKGSAATSIMIDPEISKTMVFDSFENDSEMIRILGVVYGFTETETRMIDMFDTRQTIENGVKLDTLTKSLDEMRLEMATKNDLVVLKTEIKNVSLENRNKILCYVIVTFIASIVAPFIVMFVEHNLWPAK